MLIKRARVCSSGSRGVAGAAMGAAGDANGALEAEDCGSARWGDASVAGGAARGGREYGPRESGEVEARVQRACALG